MKIAVTKASGTEKYALYGRWLQQVDADVEIVDLIEMQPDEATRTVLECDGVLFTGGPDVDPVIYGMPEKRELCSTIDAHRDALELSVAKAAYEARLPMLGICRGLQVINVAFGGTLIADLPTERSSDVEHRMIDEVSSEHAIHVEPGSLIKRICNALDGEVNSSHHQAIDTLASLFTESALSDDGVIEAFEWGDTSLGGKPFLLAVQWHPERMPSHSPFSLPIARHFVEEVRAYRALLRP
jgi:putative glutamine amidotransferase